jgi:2-methylcitrate dehydratase PrpD
MTVKTALPATTAQLVDFARGSFARACDAEAIDAAVRILLDTVACTVGAFGTPQAQSILAVKRLQGGHPEATLAVTGERMSGATVSFIHAQLGNVLDADETYEGSLHLAAPIVMPAIAAAEVAGATGIQLLAAIAIGYEVAARVGASLEAYDSSGDTVLLAPVRGYDWAALGTATAVALLRGLDADQTANAIGIAFATTPVNYDIRRCTMPLFTPGQPAIWHKYAMYGAIAEAGYNAALFAEAGFRGDPNVLDEESGYWRSFGATAVNPAALTHDLGGGRWAIAHTSIKPYPFCRHGHRALDLFLEIVTANDLGPDDIDEVTVVIPPYETLQRIVENDWPDEQLKIMMSLRYAVWMLATRVAPGPRWWAEEHLHDPRGEDFGARVRCVIEPEWRGILAEQIKESGLFTRYPVRVEVSGPRGRWSAQAEYARGVTEPAEFRLSEAELQSKAIEFTEPVIGETQSRQLVRVVQQLVEAPDVAALTKSFCRRE